MVKSSDVPNGNAKLKHLEDLSAIFDRFESQVPLHTNGNEHLKLPHFNGNKVQPIHRWYTYKEGFSSSLLAWVCEITDTNLDSIGKILDPFTGVATSLLSAQLNFRGKHKLKLVGVERNPFTAFVARTKLGWNDFDEEIVKKNIRGLVKTLSKGTSTRYEVSALSTLKNDRSFDPDVMQNLLFARELLKEKLGGTPTYPFFQLGWAACIETASNLRKDGRALRFVERETRLPVYELLENKWLQMLGDIRTVRAELSAVTRGRVDTSILEGDGRTLKVLGKNDVDFDLILYSPPYLNNLDYSEVYKLELWLTEAITTHQEFRALRSITFRSHPSCKFDETALVDRMRKNSWPRKLRDSLLNVLPSDNYLEARRRTIRGYMDDMLESLQNQYRVVKRGGFVVCVVGNSLHGNKEYPIPIATDLLITALAKSVGFEVVKVQATRHTNRRKHVSAASRESAIILRKPLLNG